MASTDTKVLAAHENGAIDLAVEQLNAGKLVAVPTETVYGLAADAQNIAAVHNIFEAKGRPANNPLICHVSGPGMANRFVDVTETTLKLMDKFWPGPLTFVLPKLENIDIPDSVSAGLHTLAVRCPNNVATKTVIEKLNRPIAAPSANPSGKLSPTCAQDVFEGLKGKVAVILDDGTANVGIESTIIGIEGDTITLLRPGTITPDQISAAAGLPILDRDSSQITAPGQLKSHYAPSAEVKLNQTTKKEGETLIGFGPVIGDLTLSKNGDLEEAARVLFATLREADKLEARVIAVAPIPQEGIGIAINDRLSRAAAPRNQ